MNACSCLTLILACIVYWQAREISRMAAAQDFPFDPGLLRHVRTSTGPSSPAATSNGSSASRPPGRPCARERLRAVRGARRWGRGVGMSEALVPAAAATAAVTDRGAAGFTLPQVIVDAGPGMRSQGFWSSSRRGSRTRVRGRSASPPCRRFSWSPKTAHFWSALATGTFASTAASRISLSKLDTF